MSIAINPKDPALNYVTVAGVPSPGRATLTGVKAPYNWDVQQSYGREGAFTIFRGRGIAKPLLTISMWALEHFLAWPLFVKLIQPPTPTKPLVVQMGHPALSAADINAVSCESIGQPERQSNGMWVAQIQLIEYRPPKPILVKPRGAIPSPDKGKAIAPKTEADIALEKARTEFEAARAAAQ